MIVAAQSSLPAKSWQTRLDSSSENLVTNRVPFGEGACLMPRRMVLNWRRDLV